MARNDFIEQLASQLGNLADGGALRRDIESKARAVLQGAFNRMDLVTRDEFEAQLAVLSRTRGKLEALENKVRELEEEWAGGPGTESREPREG